MADYQGIFSSGGGGVQTIGAGTNILVDNTDPLNPIVSVTGVALASHTHDAAAIITGTIATARLGSGTASSSTYLKGDQTYSSLDASHITVGTVATARLGSGTANNTTFLRGDQTWQTITGGVTGFIGSQNTASPNNTVNASRLLVDATSTNADIVLQPKGTGAFLAQLPDSTATGGNKRGEQAVDLQMNRNLSTQVASGTYSVVVGGQRNTAASNFAAVVGGSTNNASGVAAFIGGGGSNTTNGNYTIVVGGQSNTAGSSHSFVGGGQNNNASSTYAVIAGGFSNTSSGYAASISGGQSNNATQQYGTIGGGQSNLNFSQYGTIGGGEGNQINVNHSHVTIPGGRYALSRNPGSFVYANNFNFNVGDAQFIDNIYTGRFQGAGTFTATIMSGLAQGVVVPANTAATFQIIVSAREFGNTNVGGWIITGLAQQATAGTLSLSNVSVNLIHRVVGTWDCTVIADNTNSSVNLRVTQSAGNNIHWVGAARFVYSTITG